VLRKSSITSGLFIQDNGNPHEIVNCNKCRRNFFLSEFERDRITNESILSPLAENWEGKEEHEEIETLCWLIELSNESKDKESFPIIKQVLK
jgi:hypothetical protein